MARRPSCLIDWNEGNTSKTKQNNTNKLYKIVKFYFQNDKYKYNYDLTFYKKYHLIIFVWPARHTRAS